MIEEEEALEHVLRDIRKYLLDEEGDYITNQVIIGQEYVLYGYLVKKWIRDANNGRWCVNINKRLIKLLVTYFIEYQKSRNELHNDKRVKQKCIAHQKERLENSILNSNRPDMIKFCKHKNAMQNKLE